MKTLLALTAASAVASTAAAQGKPPAALQSAKQIRQIAVALHRHHDVHQALPPAVIRDKAGKPLYSWRVAILPFIGHEKLYKQFDLTKPWDHPANRKASQTAVPVFEHPNAKFGKAKWGMTNYRTFVSTAGMMTVLDARKPTDLRDVTINDGTSFTLMVAETKDAVPWAKPAPMLLTPGKPVPKVGGLTPGRFIAVAADASVHYLRDNIHTALLRNMITADDATVVPLAAWK